MNRSFLFSIFLSVLGVLFQAQELVTDYPGAVSAWNGSVRHDFQVNGVSCILVEPSECAPGRPWYWKARFFDAFPYPEIALLKKGWTIAYTDVADLFGAPEAVRRFDQFYRFMVSRGYHRAPALAGYSRGGLIAINFASRYPERMSSLYLDNAVCDFRTWPGSGKYPQGWENLRKAYGLTEEAAVDTPWNPVERLTVLADSSVPTLALCALKDTVVPPEKNTKILEEVFNTHGGNLTVISKSEADHHPHSLEEPAPIVEFVQKNFANCPMQKEFQDVPMLWNPDFRCQYDAKHRRLLLTLWQWPKEQRIRLTGFAGTPQKVWLETATAAESPLPVVIRPDGWYIFLPAVQPAAGDQRIFIQLEDALRMQPPICISETDGTLLLNASNGLRESGSWHWDAYLPQEQARLLHLPQPLPYPVTLVNGEKSATIAAGQQYAILECTETSIQHIALNGLAENAVPALELSRLDMATIDLDSGTVLDATTRTAQWTLPFALNLEFRVFVEYACEEDCRVQCVLGNETVALDFRATGDETRFLRLPVGYVKMNGALPQPKLKFFAQAAKRLVIRKLALVPSTVAKFNELPVDGPFADVKRQDSFMLPLEEARLIGCQLRFYKGSRCITFWINPAEYVIWPFTNVKPGRYAVSANIGTIDTSRLALNAGGKTLLVDIPNLHDYDIFQPFRFGVLEIPREQDVWLQVYPAPGYHPVNLSGLKLERIAE